MLPLVAVVLGFAGGWFLRGSVVAPDAPRPFQDASVVGAEQVATGAAALTKDEALRLLKADYDAATERGDSGTLCVWLDPQKHDAENWSYLDYAGQDACPKSLEAAGWAELGECVKPGCEGGCCERLIKPRPPVRASERRGSRGFIVSCGTFEVSAIKSIATTGNTAEVSFERKFRFDNSVATKVPGCAWSKPAEPGSAVKRRTFVRDDAGAWALK